MLANTSYLGTLKSMPWPCQEMDDIFDAEVGRESSSHVTLRFEVWAPNVGPYLSLPCLGEVQSMEDDTCVYIYMYM